MLYGTHLRPLRRPHGAASAVGAVGIGRVRDGRRGVDVEDLREAKAYSRRGHGSTILEAIGPSSHRRGDSGPRGIGREGRGVVLHCVMGGPLHGSEILLLPTCCEALRM